ncbi:short-subunit dehydrogenase [Stackebrandtia albiflava]|uniref:Short-subunit dehydrogenase n=2 Tax=Stackebrandtia albiflava TaxID=406432 RepID=A0A562VH30_9ACTN|nr:short-subunit dehydrogenase [Stackebrandtia albiflava]
MITGANRGIGRELAERVLAQGDDVIALGRDRAAMAELGCRVVTADLSAPETLAGAVAGIDRLDALVHNAGIAEVGPVAETGLDTWQRHLTVNLAAPAELTRLLLPALRAASGHVVFVNSGVGLSAGPMWSAYGASKHGLKALADALRAEEQGNGVRVTTVYPGQVATEMQRALRESMGVPYDPRRAMSAGTAAEAIRYVLNVPAEATVHDLRIAPSDPVPHATSRRR